MATKPVEFDDSQDLPVDEVVPSVSVEQGKAHMAGLREGIAKAMMASQAAQAGAQAAPGNQPIGQLQLRPNTQAQLANMGQQQLPQGQLQQPQAQGPDMQQLMAQKAAAAQAAQPQTGATNPAELNPAQYTQTQLQNLETRKGLTQVQADIKGKESDEEADIQNQAAYDQHNQLFDMQTAQQKAMNDAKERDSNLMLELQKMHNMKSHIDPNHWWNSKSTGSKIASSIGMFLMGLGGGSRIAMDHMHKAIDADIDAQKENISQNWKEIQAQHGLDESANNRANHELEWKNQFRVASMEVVKQQLAAAAARSQNPMNQANAQMAIQDINKQQDDVRYQSWQLRQKALMASSAAGQVMKDRLRKEVEEARKQQVELMNNSAAPMSEKDASATVARMHPDLVQYGMWGSGGAQMNATAPTTTAEKNAARVEEKDLESRSVTLPKDLGGGTAVARDAAAAKDFSERVGTTASWLKKLDRVEQLQADWKAGKLDASGAAEWEALSGDMTNTMNGTFAVTRQAGIGEGERIDEHILPKPPGWFMRNMGTGLVTQGPVINYMQSQNDGRIKAIKDLMEERKKQALTDLTPLRTGPQGPSGQESTAPPDYSKFGFKPYEAPKGPPPAPIPNYQGSTSLGAPGIPSYQQYRQGK